MKQHTLVIAEGSEDLREALQSQFDTFCQVFCCSTGKEALELLELRHPDILLLDLMVPQLDGLGLLQILSAMGDRPEILATTSYVSPYILETCESLGVRVLMEKPYDLRQAGERVRNLLQYRAGGNEEGRFSRISGLLLRMGFTAKLRGYSYLRDAVLHYARNPNQSIIKELYPRVAAVYGVTPEDVEHSIRSAVIDAWSHKNGEVWNLSFGREELLRPSNAALIQGLSGFLRDAEHPEAAQAL